MEVRGRNGKWLGAGSRGVIRVGRVDVVCEFCPGVCSGRGGMNAFVVVDVIECRARISQHECVGGENRGGHRRGSVDGKE